MILPYFAFIMARAAGLQKLYTPLRLVLITASQSCSSSLISRLSLVMPALFTRMSILP